MQPGALFDAEQEGGGSRLFDPGAAAPAPAPTLRIHQVGPCAGCGTLAVDDLCSTCADAGITPGRLEVTP